MKFHFLITDIEGIDKDYFVDIGLDGSETIEVAKEHFHNAIVLFRQALTKTENRSWIDCDRVDGRMSPERQSQCDEVARISRGSMH